MMMLFRNCTYLALTILILFPMVIMSNISDRNIDSINIWSAIDKFQVQFQECFNNINEIKNKRSTRQIVFQCLGQTGLNLMDEILSYDTIELSENVNLARYRFENTKGRQLPNITATSLQLLSTLLPLKTRRKDWKIEIAKKFKNMLNTYVLKIYKPDGLVDDEGRRKHKNMLFPLIIFSIVTVGMIMIPMGFKFLAVLGGKALLLAKMALILSSIQGLKKVATSHVNYGLYSAPPPPHGHDHGHWYYDRHMPYDSMSAGSVNYESMMNYKNDLLHPSMRGTLLVSQNPGSINDQLS